MKRAPSITVSSSTPAAAIASSADPDVMVVFKNVFIFYDQDEPGILANNKMANDLIKFGINLEIIVLDGDIKDAGDMSNNDAKYLMKEVGL